MRVGRCRYSGNLRPNIISLAKNGTVISTYCECTDLRLEILFRRADLIGICVLWFGWWTVILLTMGLLAEDS